MDACRGGNEEAKKALAAAAAAGPTITKWEGANDSEPKTKIQVRPCLRCVRACQSTFSHVAGNME